jgi:hypothetical protein
MWTRVGETFRAALTSADTSTFLSKNFEDRHSNDRRDPV